MRALHCPLLILAAIGCALGATKSVTDCILSMDIECVKSKVLSNLLKIERMRSYKLTEGVELVRLSNASSAAVNSTRRHGTARSKGHVEDTLVEEMARMVNTHGIKISAVPGLEIFVSRLKDRNGLFDVRVLATEGGARTMSEFGGKGMIKKLRKYLPFLMSFPMFGQMLVQPVVLVALAFLSFKSLLVGKLALVLAIVSILKHSANFNKRRMDLLGMNKPGIPQNVPEGEFNNNFPSMDPFNFYNSYWQTLQNDQQQQANEQPTFT